MDDNDYLTVSCRKSAVKLGSSHLYNFSCWSMKSSHVAARIDERSLPEQRTMKKKRLHVSLTELTRQQLGLRTKLEAADCVLASAQVEP